MTSIYLKRISLSLSNKGVVSVEKNVAPTQDAKTIISSIVCPRHFGVALSIDIYIY